MNQAKADASDDLFTTETAGLPEVLGPDVTRLADGDRLNLRIGPVRKNIDGAELRMLAYNGSIPGPTLHVDQGSEITVQVRNDGDVEATVHWHGLRLENQYDGVPDETQVPIPIGGTYTCKVRFPDAGFYWYHPHIREDFGPARHHRRWPLGGRRVRHRRGGGRRCLGGTDVVPVFGLGAGPPAAAL